MKAKRTLTFQIEEYIRELLEEKAKREERSLAYIVNKYIKIGLEKDGLLKQTKQK